MIVVRSSGPTAWVDTNGWQLVPERVIAPAEGSPGELFSPSAVVADAAGLVYVLDNRPAAIKVFAADGKFLRVVGREGSGPGEFRPYGMIYAIADTLVHQDPRQARASLFGPQGEFVRQFSSRCCESQRVTSFADGTLPIPGPLGTGQRGLLRYRLDGTASDSIPYPEGPEERRWLIQRGEDRMGQGIPFQPDLEWGLSPAGDMVYGTQDAMRFVVTRTGRDTVRVIEGTSTIVAIPDSVRQAALDDVIRNDERWRGIARLEDIPTSYPAWSALVVDASRHLWVLVPGPNGPGDRWLVFGPDGAQLGAVPAPFTDTYRSWWGSERVYHLTEDPVTSLPIVRIYRIQR